MGGPCLDSSPRVRGAATGGRSRGGAVRGTRACGANTRRASRAHPSATVERGLAGTLGVRDPRLDPGVRASDGFLNVMLHEATAGGRGYDILSANLATAILYNGMGRYDLALKAALTAFEVDEAFPDTWAAPEVVEAAVRSGESEAATGAIRLLSARGSGTDWTLGLQARSRALITADRRLAEQLYTDAIARLERTSIAFDLARAHLLYGEWLRRARRRSDASTELRTAYEIFAAMPAAAFAERAARELRAVGGQGLTRVRDETPRLTPQQTQIAFLASEGRSNQEIAAQLFISPRTVEYHLHNIFNRLGIASRNQLAKSLDRKPSSRQKVASHRDDR